MIASDFEMNEETVAEDAAANEGETSNVDAWNDLSEDCMLEMLNEPFDMVLNGSSLRTDPDYYGFDNNTGDSWIYPANLPIRSYQYNISKAGLFKNTLVVLPTGLGKTFIAAVVMYNIYRWYPMSKIIFTAPTRPLVAQQIEACRKIVGIPLCNCVEMTGKQNKIVRRELWKTKRVFFATPQVIQSDINDVEQNFPFSGVKLIVVDEAHKAKGRYAYTEVIKTIASRNQYFRVLALSATPGRNIEDVAEVVRNLLISHVEIRTETSIDVASYTFKRNLKTIVVALGERIKQIRQRFIEIIDPYLRTLIDNGVVSGSVNNLTRGWLVMEHKRFRESSMNNRSLNHSTINTDFSICISLYHALDLLERHGVRVFLNFFEEEDTSQEKFFVAMNPELKKFLDELREETGPNPFHINVQTMTNGQIPTVPNNLDFGHPKFDLVKQHLLDHFKNNIETKAIVFCEYRESVLLLYRLLLQSRPLLKPRKFVGQGGTGSIRAVTQKEQIQIMTDFKNGTCNILIATSVAEEGIDVGEVDLIICFDISTKNPTRFVQRIGRTGRRRQGQVIIVVTEGREHAVVKEVLATRDKTNHKIAKSREIFNALYRKSPSLVPAEFDPKCLEKVMVIDEIESDSETKNKAIKSKQAEKTKNPNTKIKKDAKTTKQKTTKEPKMVIKPHNDVRNYFKKIELDKDDHEIFCPPKSSSTPKQVKCREFSTKNIDLSNNEEIWCNDIPAHALRPGSVSPLNNCALPTTENHVKNLANKINGFFEKKENSKNISKVLDLTVILNSKNFPKSTKRFILERNYEFVKEKFDCMQALDAVKNDDIQVLDESAENFLEIYERLEEVFGGRVQLMKYLETGKSVSANRSPVADFELKFSKLFAGLENRKFDNLVDYYLDERLSHLDMNVILKQYKSSPIPCEKNTEKFVQDDYSMLDNNDITDQELFIDNSPNKADFSRNSDDTIECTPLEEREGGYKVPEQMKIKPISESPFFKTFVNNFVAERVKATPNHVKENSNSIQTEVEISSQLFDDDFEEYIENEPKSSSQDELRNVNNDSGTIDDPLMISVDELLDIVTAAENSAKKSSNSTLHLHRDVNCPDTIKKDENNTLKKNISLNTGLSGGENFCRTPSDELFGTTRTPFDSFNDIRKHLAKGEGEIIAEISNRSPPAHPAIVDPKNEISPSVFHSSSSKWKNIKINPSSDTIFNKSKIGIKLFTNCDNEKENEIIKKNNKSLINSSVENKLKRQLNEEIIDESVIGRKKTRKWKKRLTIDSCDSEFEEGDTISKTNKEAITPIRGKRKTKRRRCEFLCTQAEVDGSDSLGDDDFEELDWNDSIINLDEVDDDPSINMRAKYLQSIRSPLKPYGAYRIPELKKPMNYSEIFSQPVQRENISTYKEDSFVISDDDEAYEDVISQLSPLERAEAILRAQKLTKRKQINEEDSGKEQSNTKRRRIIKPHYISTSDDET